VKKYFHPELEPLKLIKLKSQTIIEVVFARNAIFKLNKIRGNMRGLQKDELTLAKYLTN
jgi:hypothetical protein